jgi:hypothetical protein
VRRPAGRKRGPWEEYALAVLLEKGIEAAFFVGASRVSAWLDERQRHASGEAKQEFEERFDAAFAAEPTIDDALEEVA